MSSFSGGVQAVGLDLYDSSTTQVHRLGERIETTDGRIFRYAKAGGSALVAGNVLQAPAQVTTHKVMTPLGGGDWRHVGHGDPRCDQRGH
jgi:hypothetical protein